MAVQSTDLLMIERAGVLHKAAVSELPSGGGGSEYPVLAKYKNGGMTTATTGTGIITLATAIPGFRSFEDVGVTDGKEIDYAIQDGSNFEYGTGVYTASGTTLTRVVSESSNAGAAINLSGSAVVFGTALAEDVGGLVLLAQEVVTSPVNAIDFALPAGYSRFKLIAENSVIDSAFVGLRLSYDGGATFVPTSTYSFSTVGRPHAGGTVVLGNGNTGTAMEIGNTAVFETPYSISGFYEFINTADAFALRGEAVVVANAKGTLVHASGWRAQTAKADALRLFHFSGANNFDSGTFSLYAYKESA